MGLKDDILEKEIIDTVTNKPKRGFLLARFDRIQGKGSALGFTIQGESLASKRFCGANNNMLEVYKPKNLHVLPQYIGQQTEKFDFLTCKIPESEWILVTRTEFVNRNDKAEWQQIQVQKSKLCNDIDSLPLLFKVMDYKTNSGSHKLVGATILTLQEIRAGHPIARHEISKPQRKNRGFIKVTSITEHASTDYNFVDYLKGGLNIALFIGIDFTVSNGGKSTQGSLHYIDESDHTKMNPYQLVIKECGDILLDYDDDKLVPVYGFGADLRYPDMKSTGVSHSFPCSGKKSQEEVKGLEGIFEVYRYALEYITFSAPTHFAPLFRDILKLSKDRVKENPDNYSFFMIITDGEIHDMEQTVSVLVDACELPISIVIVGVGKSSFAAMRQLDEGDCVDGQGRKPSRDICRFVRFEYR